MVAIGVEEEEHIQRSEWNIATPIPEVPFAQYVMDKMSSGGDKTALIDGVSGETLKYNELISWIRNISSGWQEAGLAADHVVCIVTPNCIHAPAAFLAAVTASAVVTFANPLFTPDELRRHINHSQSKWIVVHPVSLHTLQAAFKELNDFKGVYLLGNESKDGIQPLSSLWKEAPEEWECCGVSGSRVVHLPYSSGTTGFPKGVELTSENWLATLVIAGGEECINIESESVVLSVLPIFHVFGIGLILISLTHKATIVSLHKFIPNVFLNAIQTYKVNYVPLVPPLAIFLAKHELVAQFDLSSMKKIICGAASLPSGVQELLHKRFSGLLVRQGYGMTETTLVVLNNRIEDPGTVGKVTALSEIKITDVETGDSLGPGKDGELCVRGPTIMKGYLNNEEATKAAIDSRGWLHTGDIGHYDENGNFYIVDRIKEIIKYKGFQVPPAELEGLLLNYEAIADVAVVGVKDEVAGELPKAYVVPKPGRTIIPDDLIKWVHERVAPHKRLRGGVEIIGAVPRSPAGKTLRRLLSEKANA